MTELALHVERLVALTMAAGKARAKDRALGAAVQAVLDVFDPADLNGLRGAIRALDAGLAKGTDLRGPQILRLALGVLVEAGAPAELVWPTAERGLVEAVAMATDFARACSAAEDTPSIKDAVSLSGRTLAPKYPKEYAAWESLSSRGLLAVACVAHSAKLRLQIQTKRQDLLDALSPLEEDVEPLLFFRQIARVLPDQTMLAIHPGQRRGWRVKVQEVSTNLELFVLLADAIVGDPKKRFLDGRRPSKKAIAALKDPDHAPTTPPEVPLPWHLAAWTALAADGTLPDPRLHAPRNWVAFENVPFEIQSFEGERVILFTKPMMPRTLEVEASYETLKPRVTLQSKLSAATVDALLRRMGKAAVKADARAAAADARIEATRLRSEQLPDDVRRKRTPAQR